MIKRHARDRWRDGPEPEVPSRAAIDPFVSHVLQWFDANGRDYPWRETTTPLYQKIVAEILLKRTRADKVASVFHQFVESFSSWSELAAADLKDLQRSLYPLGLWRQKATDLAALASEMVRRGGEFPTEYDEIRALPGIGQYLANAIALFTAGEPRPLVDANFSRVVEKYFGPRELADIRDDPYLQGLAYSIVEASDEYERANFAILDFGALICRKTPLCPSCPISEGCRFLQQVEKPTWASSSRKSSK